MPDFLDYHQDYSQNLPYPEIQSVDSTVFCLKTVLARVASRRLSILYPGARDLRTQLMTLATDCVL